MGQRRQQRPRVPWRARVLGVVVPVMALSFAAVGLMPEVDVDLTAPQVAEASETECLPTGPRDSVAALNRFAATVRGGGEFAGADVGASGLLQDGRRLMVFGDTLRAADFDGQRFVRNSMLVFDERCMSVVLPADHGALIPDRADGVGYWPMSVAVVERRGYDLVVVFAQRVRGTAGTADAGASGDVFAFENLGPAAAVFVVRRGQAPQLADVRDFGPDEPDTTSPTWGAASAVDDDWLYLYGTSHPDEPGVFGFALRVARVRPDEVLDTGAWRYWDGTDWVEDDDAAAELIPPVGGVSQTLSVFEKDGGWYAVSKRDEFLGDELAAWTAPAPTGPFGEPVALAELPSTEEEYRYMPLAHPDLLPEPGSVVVSYSRNSPDVTRVVDNPFLYRPRFLRVELPAPVAVSVAESPDLR